MALGNQLQFRMGRFKDDQGNLILNNVAKKAGTVYVTTDEKAMYVDVDDSTRIRLGDVIQLNSVREAAPPFSEDALYYFIEENALLKWGPFGTDGAMAWKQLNSVSDVTANLTALTNRVTEAESAIATNTTNIATNAAKIATNAEDIDALELTVYGNETVDGLVDKVDILTGDKDTVGSLKNIEDKVTTNATDITGLKNRLTTAENTISSNTTLAQKGVDDAKAAKEAADAAQGDATQALTNAAAAQSKADQADGKADTNANAITALGNRVTPLETKVSTLENTTIPGIVENVSDNSELIAGLRADLGTNDKADTNAFARIKTLETSLGDGTGSTSVTARLDAVEDKADANGTAITELQGASTSQADRITNLEGYVGEPGQGQADATVFELIATNTGDIAENTGKIATNTSDITQLKADIKSHGESITSINNTLSGLDATYVNETDYATDKAALEAKIDDGLAEINETIDAANAMTYKQSVKTYAELPTSGVEVGDTYVVASDGGFIEEGNEVYYAGDLLVARGTEYTADTLPEGAAETLIGTINPDTLTWDHVTTGYIQAHEPELKAVDSETKNAIDVRLSSFSGKETDAGDLGKFTIVGGENVTVSVDGTVITIGMAWDTF